MITLTIPQDIRDKLFVEVTVAKSSGWRFKKSMKKKGVPFLELYTSYHFLCLKPKYAIGLHGPIIIDKTYKGGLKYTISCHEADAVYFKMALFGVNEEKTC